MSDDEYADDGFEASGGASSPGNAADVLKNAASSLKEPITSTAPNSYRSPRVDPPSNKSSARGKSSTMKAALGENDLNSSNAGTPNPLSSTAPSIPSASVPPKKKSKEKKKEERRKEKKLRKKEKKEKRAKRKGGEKERPPSPKFASRLWASNTRSLFARSVELTSGTRHGSALMHAAYAGDDNVGDLQRILAGPKKKKKKSKYDSDSDADVDDDEQSVMRRNNEFAERSWTQKLKETDDQGWTALHWAASKGHTEVVRELLEADRRGGGEEGEGEDEFGGAAGGGAPLIDLPELLFEWTPLFLACIELHVDTVEELLSAGADANLTDSLGDRPLEACAKSRAGRRKDAIRKMLKKHMDDDGLSSDSDDDEEEEEEEEEEESSSGSSEGEASWAGSDSSDDSSSDDDDGRRKRR